MSLRRRIAALERSHRLPAVIWVVREPHESRAAFKERYETLRQQHPEQSVMSADFGGPDEASNGKT